MCSEYKKMAFLDFKGFPFDLKLEGIKPFREAESGSFGSVDFYSLDLGLIAIKFAKKIPGTAEREIENIKMLGDHPNIIKFLCYHETPTDATIVMEMWGKNLSWVNRRYSFTEKQVITISLDITNGVNYIHSRGLMHRDLKPQNILFNGKIAKICDFGSAKNFPATCSTFYICSRFYRAPELLLGSTAYGENIDFWSLGCIFSELITKRPLFQGEDNVEMVKLILRAIGTPTKEELEEMKTAPCEVKEQIPGVGIKKLISKPFHMLYIALIEKTLCYSPGKRKITSADFELLL
jgi:glycogen synthase kinase 3 beta